MKLWALLPELTLAAVCLALVPAAGFVRGRARVAPAVATFVGLAAAVAFTLRMLPWAPVAAMHGTYAVDGFAHVMKLLVLCGALIALLFFVATHRDHPSLPHVPIALAFSTLGAMGLASSVDLVLVVLFIQMSSMAVYVLVASRRTERSALEAGIKVFLYGAVALGVMAYGLSFVYGLGGTLDMRQLAPALASADPIWLGLAFALVFVGYAFEATLVPFHPWAPDVYEGASAAVSGFVSVVPKVGGFAALLRFLMYVLPEDGAAWPAALAVIAALTMTLGNLAALTQTRLKRLLAYSSIAQAGYVLMAVAVIGRSGGALGAVAYYLAAYVFMNLGAFGVAALIERARGDDSFDSLRGLVRRHPATATVLLLSLLSLAGIPPLSGFAGKVLLLGAVIDADLTWLALIAAINMAVALYYYVHVAAEAVVKGETEPAALRVAPSAGAALGLAAVGTIALGVVAGPALELVARVEQLLR